MIDIQLTGVNLTSENYKDYILDLERENLKNINKEDKKSMVAKIIRVYEECNNNGNK